MMRRKLIVGQRLPIRQLQHPQTRMEINHLRLQTRHILRIRTKYHQRLRPPLTLSLRQLSQQQRIGRTERHGRGETLGGFEVGNQFRRGEGQGRCGHDAV